MSTSDTGYSIDLAGADDLPAIKRLLAEADLPVQGVDDLIDAFVVVQSAGDPRSAPLAVGAIEDCDRAGLLRSIVVHPDHRGQGLGLLVTSALIEAAAARGFDALYLLTETAESFFTRVGFESIARDTAPDSIRDTDEFRSLCPDSAVLMRLDVGDRHPLTS